MDGLCLPINVVCESGYVLSPDKRKCIPEKDLMIPFVFIGLFIVISIPIIVLGCVRRQQ